MKTNNFIIELNKVDSRYSKYDHENNSLNGFRCDVNGVSEYEDYLNDLFIEYFNEINDHINNLLLCQDVSKIIIVINNAIKVFNDLKEKIIESDEELKELISNLDELLIRDNFMYEDRKEEVQEQQKLSCLRYNFKNNIIDIPALYENLFQKNGNEWKIEFFILRMEKIGRDYIYNSLDKLNDLLNSYFPPILSQKSTKVAINKADSTSWIDEYFEKHFANKDITNKEIALMFDITRPTIQEWREQGKIIMISEQGKRPIIYSKEKLIEDLKDGTIKDRLKNIVQNGSK